MSSQQPKLIDTECKFIVYGKDQSDKTVDYHYVKELQHFDDGTTKSVFKALKNLKRPFYITKKGMQNHKEKKDFEKISNVDKFECTQSDLIYSIAKQLGQPYFRGSLRDICSSPYVYMADLDSCSYFKKTLYQDRMNSKDLFTPYKIAVFDVETNVLSEDEEIIMASVTCGDTVYHAVCDYVLKSPKTYEQDIVSAMNKHSPDLVKTRNLKFHIKVVSTPVQVLQFVINGAHEIRPDILTGWNLDFDIGKAIQACENENYPIEYIFSHPTLPKSQKFFKYVKSPEHKVTASGKSQPIMNYDRWHWVHTPATFMIIDFMQAYKRNRIGSPELPRYSLEAILEHEEIGVSKLKIKEAEAYKGLDWHIFMQRNFIIDYGAYNIIDCIAPEMLDEKTVDLSIKLPTLLEFSHPSIYHKQPRHASNLITFDALEDGYVFATAGNQKDEFDKYIDSRSGWITAQPTLALLDEGLECTEIEGLKTRLFVACLDSDVSGAYPSNQIVGNVAVITTAVEFVDYPGLNISKPMCRQFTLDTLCGQVNHITTMNKMCKLPTLSSISELFDKINK
jgi:hypothetical protein